MYPRSDTDLLQLNLVELMVYPKPLCARIYLFLPFFRIPSLTSVHHRDNLCDVSLPSVRPRPSVLLSVDEEEGEAATATRRAANESMDLLWIK